MSKDDSMFLDECFLANLAFDFQVLLGAYKKLLEAVKTQQEDLRERSKEIDRLKGQLDPESIQHWDTMRKQRDDALVQVEQLRMQLTACGVAASGNVAEQLPKCDFDERRLSKGDYAWSATYEEVADLRERYDKVKKAVEGT